MRLSALVGVMVLAATPLLAQNTAGPPAPGLIKETLGDGIYLFRAPSALDLWTATNVVVIVNERDVTIELFAAILDQVHAALERGVVGVDAVVAAVDVDAIGRRYRPEGSLASTYRSWVGTLARKAYQEAMDGIAR